MSNLSAFEEAHGEIPYGITDDYMFRSVLQSKNKGLICSMLHLSEEEVLSVEITNPIVLDTLNPGQDYAKAMPVIHIGFLDYTLSDDFPEFHATYKLINVKSHQIYKASHAVDYSEGNI